MLISNDETSIRRRSARIAPSLSLIAHRRTKTWASWKELIRTGLLRRGRQASNFRAIRTSFMRPHVEQLFRDRQRADASYDDRAPRLSKDGFSLWMAAVPTTEFHSRPGSWSDSEPIPCSSRGGTSVAAR